MSFWVILLCKVLKRCSLLNNLFCCLFNRKDCLTLPFVEMRKSWFSVIVQSIWQWKKLFIFFQKLSWDLKASGLPLMLTLVQQPSSYVLPVLKALFLFITSICGAIWSLRSCQRNFPSLFFPIILSIPLIRSGLLGPNLAMAPLHGSKNPYKNCIFLIYDHIQNI